MKKQIKTWTDRVFDDTKDKLIIEFHISSENTQESCRVSTEIYWQKAAYERYTPEELFLNQERPIFYNFGNGHTLSGKLGWQLLNNPNIEDNNEVWGELKIEKKERVDAWSYQGFMVGFIVRGGDKPIPPRPPQPIPNPKPYESVVPRPNDLDFINLEIDSISSNYQDLFPYLYVKPWPSISKAEMDSSFIFFPSQLKSSCPFYKKLLELTKENKRVAIENEAVKFINDGINPGSIATYKDQFIDDISQLKSIFKHYLDIGDKLLKKESINFEDLETIITEKFGSWSNFESLTKVASYQEDESKLWASIFALVIRLGYRQDLLEHLFLLLMTQKILLNTLKCVNKNSGNKSDGINCKASETLLNKWFNSNIVLAKDIFPLVPVNSYAGSPPSPINPTAALYPQWVKPYAIAALQIVRFKLSGYELGEIKKIENILKGETRELSHRNLKKHQTEELQNAKNENHKKKNTQLSTNDLLSEVQKTLSERKHSTTIKDYTTNYGEPTAQTAKVNGTWWVDEKPAGGFSKDKSHFAKDILDLTQKRISEQVSKERRISDYDEVEVTQTSRFDNTHGNENIRGVYQWLNKSYYLNSINSGNRFIIEIFLHKPAESFIQNYKDYFKIDLKEPLSPKELGLLHYSDIQTEKVKSPPSSANNSTFYYLNLFQQFQVEETLPPPIQTKSYSAVIKNEKPLTTRNIEISENYKATHAIISIASYSKNVDIQVMIGTSIFPYKANGNKGMSIPLTEDMSRIPISILCKELSKSPPEALEYIAYYVANVEIVCVCRREFLEQWKFHAYTEITAAYQKQVNQYYEQINKQKELILSQNNEINEELKNGQIITQSMKLLFGLATCLTAKKGDSKKTQSEKNLDEFQYYQYFEKSVDWKDMLCHLEYEKNAKNVHENLFLKELNSDLHFRNFLRSKQAKILVPIKADFAKSFMFFLQTGQIWSGKESLSPLVWESLELFNDLKKSELMPSEIYEESWNVLIPTSMCVLRHSSEIPSLENEDN